MFSCGDVSINMAEIKSSQGRKSDIKEESKLLCSDSKHTQPRNQEKTWRAGWTLYYLMPVIVVGIGSLLSYVSLYSTLNGKPEESDTSNRAKPVLLSSKHVAKHDGSDPSLPIYLVVLGKVFNVDKGKKFYAPGSGYNVFAGRDSTPSFITGKFSRDEATDDVSGLTPEEMLGVKNWIDFYRKEYTYVGKMIGRYYDSEGNPTEALKAAGKKIKEGKMLKKAQEEQSKRFPGCNSQWSRDEGSTVWCSKDR